jgi:hypothetical protein
MQVHSPSQLNVIAFFLRPYLQHQDDDGNYSEDCEGHVVLAMLCA